MTDENNTAATNAVNKKVLLVEDDESLRMTLEQMLKQQGFEVFTAGDGVAAQNLIPLHDFAVVVSDIRLPNMNGIQLLHYIKRTKPMPVILMTGFSEISETKEAFELGAKGFLAKPFRKADLLAALGQVLGEEAVKVPEKPADTDDMYTGLRIEEFITGKEILFDIFVRLAEGKYVKVGSGGESIGMDRIAKYREKGLHYLFLRKEDFRRYLGFTKTVSQKVADSNKVDRGRKMAFLTQTSKSAMNMLYRDKIDKETFDLATDLVSTASQVLCEQPEAYALFELLKSQGEEMYVHSLGVSLYSTLVARAVGWTSPRTLTRLAMAGIMHDIGKKEIDAAILAKPRVALNAEEIKQLETHPTRGYEILRQLPEVPEEVMQIALQHHEDCKGMGYPMRHTKNHIIPLARLVGVVEEFCELAFPPTKAQTPLSANEALKRINESSLGRLDQEYLDALNRVFQGISLAEQNKTKAKRAA